VTWWIASLHEMEKKGGATKEKNQNCWPSFVSVAIMMVIILGITMKLIRLSQDEVQAIEWGNIVGELGSYPNLPTLGYIGVS
jgi:hypothetical protein